MDNARAVIVTDAGEADRGAWDRFVDDRLDASPIVKFGVSDALAEAYPVTTLRLMARRPDGTVSGLLVVYFGRHGGRVMFSPSGGLVAADDAIAGLLRGAADRARRHRLAASAISRMGRPLGEGHARWTKTTLVRTLDPSPDTLWSSIRKKTRYTIRRAAQQGIETRWGVESLPDFYDAYRARMAEKGLACHPIRFFEAMARCFDGFRLVVARQGDRALGGMVFLFGRRRALYHFNATYGDALSLGVNHLMMWEAMKRCVAEGISTLDFGESTPGGGVFEFKSMQFGGLPQEVHYADVLREGGDGALSELPAPFAYRVRARLAEIAPARLRASMLAANRAYERVL